MEVVAKKRKLVSRSHPKGLAVRGVSVTSIFQVISLAWSFQAGVLPGLDYASPSENNYFSEPALPFYWQCGVEFRIPVFTWTKTDKNGLYLGGQMTNIFSKDARVSYEFDPLQDTYSVDAGVRWQELTVGYEHACTHSVENDVAGKIVSQELFGAYDKLFVKIEGSI